jgi:hypothetical protein
VLCLVIGFMSSTTARRPAARWCSRIGLTLLMVIALEVCALTVGYPLYEDSLTYRQRDLLVEIAGRGSFLVGFMAMGLLLVSAFMSRSAGLLSEVAGGDEDRYFVVRAVCPRCRTWFRLASGGAACPGCGLEITVADA